MPRFHVRDTFEISGRELFILAGEIVEGEIRPGMFVQVPLNSGISMTLLIHGVEFARRAGGEDVCLGILAGPDLAELLCALSMGDESFEVTAEGSE